MPPVCSSNGASCTWETRSPCPRTPPCCTPGCCSITASFKRRQKRAWPQAARASRLPTRPRRCTPPTWSRASKRGSGCSCRLPSAPRPRLRQRAARQRLVLERLCPGPLLPGRRRGRGPGAGLGQQVKDSLEKAIALSPRHVEARIALGHLPRRSHRQSGGDGGRHDLWRQKKLACSCLKKRWPCTPARPLAWWTRQRPGHARRRRAH